VVVTKPGHRYKVYELASEKSFTMTEFAAELARQSGDDLAYVDLAAEDFQALLVSSGVAERAAQSLADYDRAVAAGELIVATGDMQRLLGRPVTELPEAISTALAGFRDI
jgi:NAD(P)H dehydrogenase (quinone)